MPWEFSKRLHWICKTLMESSTLWDRLLLSPDWGVPTFPQAQVSLEDFRKGDSKYTLALPFLGPSNGCVEEKAMATHSSTLAWEIPWTEKPGRLQLWRGCEESDTTEWIHFHFSLSCIEEGNGNPLQYSCLENPRDGRASWAAVYGVTQSQTRLTWLSSSSSNECVCNRYNVVTRELSWEYYGSFLPMSYTKGPFLKYLFKLPVLWLVTL